MFSVQDDGTQASPDFPYDYLFCGSRLERIKGQKNCIEILNELNCRGHGDIHLVFAGRVSEQGFDDELREDAIRYGLGERFISWALYHRIKYGNGQ